MSELRTQLLNIQRNIYRRNLKYIRETLLSTPSIDRYARRYHRYIKYYETLSTKTDLIRRILASDIVYHGDYHTLKQSQRAVLRIIRDIVGKRELILCVEMFHGQDQRFIDQFMQDTITENTFLKKIHYKKKWGYRWENWKPILTLCKQHLIRILGINSEQKDKKNSLAHRDIYAAKIIALAAIQNPDTLIYVVDGDYHICPAHLPYQVERLVGLFDIELKRTIIYQNEPTLYWQLAEVHKEEADVLQISSDSFCIMNTTPANKLQSYLNWLDYSEDAYYPIQSDWSEGIEDSGNTSIPALVHRICTILSMPYPVEALDHLDVYYGTNLDFMSTVSQSPALAHLLPKIKKKISTNDGFLLEHKQNNTMFYIIYLPNSSLNMAAEEATHFLNAVQRGAVDLSLQCFDRFYYTVITETVGFFGSKLINEKRKAPTRNALRRYLGTFKQKKPSKEDKEKITISRIILQHRYLESHSNNPQEFKKKFNEIYRARTSIPSAAATQLGYMLGDKLYNAVKTGTYPLQEIITLFSKQFTRPHSAFETYMNISSQFL